MAKEEYEGASIQEQLVAACRTNNTELLESLIESIGEDEELSRILNNTTDPLGNHLYHVAAAQGQYDVIDILLDQDGFECDPVNRTDSDTPLHTAIKWLNSEPPAQREFGKELINMMLEAGSNSRLKNKAGLTPLQLVDPSNEELRTLIKEHEFKEMMGVDFIDSESAPAPPKLPAGGPPSLPGFAAPSMPQVSAGDDDEFSGSDEEERAEWEQSRGKR